MKSFVYKFASLLLTFTILLSACGCIVSAVSVQSDTHTATVSQGDKNIYYVSAQTGSQFTGEGTLDKPYKFISSAITKAVEDGFSENDTVYVRLLHEKTIQWGENANTPSHEFNLIVESDDRSNLSSVNIIQATYLGGPTEIRYGIYMLKNIYSQLRLNNKDLTIGDGASVKCLYYTFGDNSTQNTIPGQNVVFKNAVTSPYICLSNNLNSNNKKYTGDLNVTVDNSDATPTFLLSGQEGKVYYNANVNFNILEAKYVNFGIFGEGTNEFNGAIQLITNKDTIVDPEGLDYINNVCNPSKGIYHLVNTSEYKDVISFTDTEGVYAVDTEKYEVIADDGANLIKAKDGILTLTSGNYSLNVTKIKEDYVKVITEKLENTTINVWETEHGVLNIDNTESVATIDFGTNIYEDVKINVLNAKKITFKGTPTINGSLYVAVNSGVTVEGKSVIDSLSAKEGKWYIVNKSGSDISFGDQVGEVLYTASGKEYVAVSGGKIYEPTARNFLLREGEYTIKPRSKGTQKYSKFIEYRGDNLANTYAKIQNGEKLNVAYFGGSVTNGSGATSPADTSWRGLIGKWFENTYPNVEINNINAAIGATGSNFGIYRLDRYVTSEKPDLLFIEFSVNDYYDLRYTGLGNVIRSESQLETIIRLIRKKLPECDIVVLHTFEKKHMGLTQLGLLYAEAQSHYEVAKHYDVTTINIGSALASSMSANWESEWDNYIEDDVHPNDKGYEIYYNAIKEYLANCLVYTEHTGKVSRHSIPVMYSDLLRNGNIKFIDADDKLIKNSEALGGKGFTYRPGGLYLQKETGSVVSTSGEDSVIVVEFTGTELAMALDSNSNVSGFKVKIDNGKYKDLTTVNITPRLVATGLTSGKHTVYIKPVSSSDSSLMRIIGFYTRDESKALKKCTSHSFKTYESDNNATCQEDGTKTSYCTKCFTTKTVADTGSILQHVFDDENDTICNLCSGDATLPQGKVLIKDTQSGKWYYYNNGLKSDTTTLIKFNGKWFFVENGEWKSQTKLVKYEGKWFYVQGGKWLSTITDLKKYNGKWFYIKNGKWSNTANTLMKINGKWFLITKGKWEATTGIVKYKDKDFFVKGGKWNASVNTLYKKNSKLYAIKSGKWYKSKAIISYGGKKYYCNKGYAQLSFSGKVKVGSKTYTIKKGIVK